MTFIDKDGDRHTFEVSAGDNLLDIAQANDLEMEGESEPAFTAAMLPSIPRTFWMSISTGAMADFDLQGPVVGHAPVLPAMSLSKTKKCTIRFPRRRTTKTTC